MSLYVLEAVLWIFGIRGHVPQDGDYPRPDKPSLAVNASRLLRVVAAAIMAIAFLALMLWVAVWLSLRLL